MRFLILFTLAIFTVQIFDIPPSRNLSNPKTCCGRTICQCTHGKGALCPIRYKAKSQAAKISSKPVLTHGKACPFHSAASSVKKAQTVKSSVPAKGIRFTKGPCGSDAPKTVLPHYAKEFICQESSQIYFRSLQDFSLLDSPRLLPLAHHLGIEHPPRAIFSSF